MVDEERHLSPAEPAAPCCPEAKEGSVARTDATGRTEMVPALLGMFDEATAGKLVLSDGEEDVHMAIESRLTRDLGQVGKRLHAARSRNDQVALALRLHVRE